MLKTNTNSAFDLVTLSSKAISAFQTTRLNPLDSNASILPYGNFNLGLHVDDEESQVLNNRRQLLKFLPSDTKIQWLDQVHGNEVAVINEHNEQVVTADALVTSTRNLALAVMTADCLPILLKSSSENEIAAIHGGWRPLRLNIIENTLNKMASQPSEIEAWLGPCIGATSFEVGEEVKLAFQDVDGELATFFRETDSNKFLADLPGIATYLLQRAGVKKIAISSPCTVENKLRYYSYRRDKVTGRMATIIVIN
ncbi:peptidoglycan editing factor PgeF [Thalassotalea marina]|uniref:Purine nucleoside phosphorylase n=1 Tax=Thalassotalea marina TaxID=1673741 RepID=A0A919ENJ6_9GAMM|nr:peptidoglycan editing factor PgeF [Thalassotalea marina]GHG02399.1 laccase domain protein [Thalassotalea marina]